MFEATEPLLSYSFKNPFVTFESDSASEVAKVELVDGDISTAVDGDNVERLAFEVSHALFEDFYRSVSSADESNADPVQSYFEICEAGVASLRHLMARFPKNSLVRSMLWQLKGECRSYWIAKRIAELEFSSARDDCTSMEVEDPDSALTQLIADDAEFRQLSVLLESCERNVSMDPLVVNELNRELKEIERDCDLRTETLRARKRGERLCDLDLDGALHGRLHERDENMQSRAFCMAFKLLRMGRINEAINLLDRCGVAALIPSLQLRQMTRESSLTSFKDDARAGRYALARASFQTAVDVILDTGCAMSQMERYLWGVAAGRLDPVIDVSQRVDDRLWCYLNAAVECRIDAKLATINADVPRRSSNAALSGADLGLTSIFAELAANTTAEEVSPYYMSYCFVVSGDSETHVEYLRNWLSERGVERYPHLLRYLVHAVLLYIQRGMPVSEESAHWSFEQFANLLIRLEMFTLVPFYVCRLPQRSAQHILVTFMHKLEESKREPVLEAVLRAGLDVTSLCKKICSHTVKICRTASEDPTSDSMLLHAWKWLLYPGRECLLDSVIESNNIFRYFFVEGKLEQAKALMYEDPEEAAKSLAKFWASLHAGGGEPRELRQVLSEQRAYLAYFKALESFEQWFKHAHFELPKLSEKPTLKDWTALHIYQKTAFELRQSSELSTHERVVAATKTFYKKAIGDLWEIINFPDGWLRCAELADDSDQEEVSRYLDLRVIREKYLTAVVNMLISMADHMRDRETLTQLVNALASTDNTVVQALTKDQLRAVVRKLSVLQGVGLWKTADS